MLQVEKGVEGIIKLASSVVGPFSMDPHSFPSLEHIQSCATAVPWELHGVKTQFGNHKSILIGRVVSGPHFQTAEGTNQRTTITSRP